jgi:hypothetical protein
MSYPEPMPIFFGPEDRQQLAAALRVHEGPNQFRPGGRFPQRAEYGEPEPLRVTFLALHRYWGVHAVSAARSAWTIQEASRSVFPPGE